MFLRGEFFCDGIAKYHLFAEMVTTTTKTNVDHFFTKIITPKVSTPRDVFYFIFMQGAAR